MGRGISGMGCGDRGAQQGTATACVWHVAAMGALPNTRNASLALAIFHTSAYYQLCLHFERLSAALVSQSICNEKHNLCTQACRATHKRAMGELADAHWRVARLQLALRLWRELVLAGAPARERLQALLCEHERLASARSLRWALDAWCERHRTRLVRKVLMGRAVVHCGLALRRRVFGVWRTWARGRMREQQTFCAALVHWRRRSCFTALSAWCDWHAHQLHKRYAPMLNAAPHVPLPTV